MAVLTVQSYSWDNIVIEFEEGPVPVLRLNLDFGVAFTSGDTVNNIKFYGPPASLVSPCGCSYSDNVLNNVLAMNIPTSSWQGARKVYNGVEYHLECTYSRYSTNINQYKWALYIGSGQSNTALVSRISNTTSPQQIGLGFLFYDVVGDQYLTNTSSDLYQMSNDTATNYYGLAKAPNGHDILVCVYDFSQVRSIVPWTAYGVIIDSRFNDFMANNSHPPIAPSTDPYAGAGASGPGGGDGTFDFSSTPIDFPGLPTIGAYSTGFLNVYVPSAANLRALSAYMWAGAFDIDNFRKLVASPMDAIMGLSIVPVTASEIGVESTTLVVGNISTGISMPRARSQYVSINCGTVEMPAKWGAYLDFSPYTKLQLYLPYIGFVDISPDDVMTANMENGEGTIIPGSISVQYHVDILSGSCIAFVKCRDHVIYEYGGQCACSCPVTEGQYKNGLLGMLEIISTVSSTAAAVTGGPGEKASKANKAASTIGKIGAIAEGALGVIDSTVSMIKPTINRSGSVGGSNGLMGYQIPYLVLTVPHMCIPGDQNVYIGYPSFVTLDMSDLAGFTQIQITHLNNMTCTSDEVDEIITLLGEGVIF